jgi:hypothetical protein
MEIIKNGMIRAMTQPKKKKRTRWFLDKGYAIYLIYI